MCALDSMDRTEAATTEMLSTLSPLARRAREAVDATAVIVTARLTGKHAFEPAAVQGLTWKQVQELHAGLAAANEALERGESVSISELSEDPRTAGLAAWEEYDLRRLLSVPLLWEGKKLGAIHALNPTLANGADSTTNIMDGLARHAAVALANAQLTRTAERLSDELESLMAIDEVVLSARDIEEIETALITKVAPMTGAVTGGIMVFDEDRQVLRMLPGSFGADDNDAVSCQVSADHPTSNSARVFATGKSYMSNDALGDPAILQDYVDLFHVERILTIPLTLGGRRIGVLHLANKPTPFTQGDLEKAEKLAPRIATLAGLGQSVLHMRRQQSITAALVNVAMGIASGGSLQDLLPGVMAELGELTEADALALVFTDRRGSIAWRRDESGGAIDHNLLTRAREQTATAAEDITPRAAGDPGRSTLLVPVHLEGTHIATMVALRDRAEPFAEHERDGFTRLKNLTALAWAAESNRRQRAEVATLRERQRIADDLHDTVAQLLFAAQVDLESVLESNSLPAATAATVAHARGLLLRGDAEIRDVIHQLSRPTRADLAHRLTLLVEELEEELGLDIHLEVSKRATKASSSVRKAVADAMIKMAQEAIVNAAKHAAPHSAHVHLKVNRAKRLVLSVADDGIGIQGSRDTNGHGLAAVRRTIREHGGQVRVGGGRFGGTKVTANVPL